MKYIRGTYEFPIIIDVNGTVMLKWWINGSYGVHPNIIGHSVGGLCMGRCFPISDSTKQKLNNLISTES